MNHDLAGCACRESAMLRPRELDHGRARHEYLITEREQFLAAVIERLAGAGRAIGGLEDRSLSRVPDSSHHKYHQSEQDDRADGNI
jgi:hypothetical protein